MEKPEHLTEKLAGFWSRRIDDTNRLVYAIDDSAITVSEVTTAPTAKIFVKSCASWAKDLHAVPGYDRLPEE